MQPRRRFSVACLQTNLRDDMAANIAQVSALARQAKAAGAELIATPENSGFMGRNAAASLAAGRSEAEHPALAAYRDLAREMETWLLVGSLAVREDGANRNANRSYLLGPDGEIKARYDKIHLFDVDLPSGETYRESNSIAGGDAAVLTPTPFGALGMTVCYDLRFPHLYRHLAQAGADFLTIPAAFTKVTGEAHWHVLQRARAIETGCYVFAPAQTGTHANDRKTYGHALIVNPWGEVLADAGTEPGFITATIDPMEVAKARGRVPAINLNVPFAANA